MKRRGIISWLCRAESESDPLLQHSPHAVAAAVVQLLRQGDELALHRNFRALGTASIIKCAHSPPILKCRIQPIATQYNDACNKLHHSLPCIVKHCAELVSEGVDNIGG